MGQSGGGFGGSGGFRRQSAPASASPWGTARGGPWG
jgi:hypothetical protein